MDGQNVDPKYEFEAPKFFNFDSGLGDDDTNVDSWFEGKPDDEGGVRVMSEIYEVESKVDGDSQRPRRKAATVEHNVRMTVDDLVGSKSSHPVENQAEKENSEKCCGTSEMRRVQQAEVESMKTEAKTEPVQPVNESNHNEDHSSVSSDRVSPSASDAEHESGDQIKQDAQEEVEKAEINQTISERSEIIQGQTEENVISTTECNGNGDGTAISDNSSQNEGQTNSSSDTNSEEIAEDGSSQMEKRVTRASKRNRSLDIASSDLSSKKTKHTPNEGGKDKRARSLCSSTGKKGLPLTKPITPQCLKRLNGKPTIIKLKTSEELEMECISKLRKQTKRHIKVNEKNMKQAISACPMVNRANGTGLTKPQEFHFQTDTRVKPQPLTTKPDNHDMNGEDVEKGFWNSLRQHPPSPSWKNRGATVPKPFNLSDGGQKKRKRSLMDKDASETDSYESMAYQVYKFQTTTPPRFRTRKANDAGFKSDNEAGQEKTVEPKITIPKTPNLSTKSRTRPPAEDALSVQEREEKEIEEMRNYKFKAKPLDRRIIESDGMYGVKKPVETTAVTKPKPFVFESDERLVARKDKALEEQETQANFKAMPQPNFEKVFRPQLKHERTEPKPFSFEDKDKERWQKKEVKIQEVYREEEKLREFKAQPLPSDSPDSLPAVFSKCNTNIKPFALNTENRGAKKAEKWIKKVKMELEESRQKTTFKAKPSKVTQEAPFVPQKSRKPLTEASVFTLNTIQRAERRDELETIKKEREQVDEELRREREAEREREEQEALVELRKQLVHKAQPIHKYKSVKVKPSSKPLTEAHSPIWSEIKRRRLEDHR